ncbi:hypothetical protein MJO28_000887 [Puccinia striiformis f. sp. tritici]|uniref:Myb/SANT-like domain-containing protein n=4 Tax=Puccinia striiformis TaxID=27350 RepID=A0A0L0VRY3_9BASI|nr:hypothetical protein Pst134EA_000359 [Puccinia striiformis f. sp. tritici]KNF01780.1 hypothetical protein PSTG_04900 [Puccinia striiformis f. sp. tritici PST-78]POW14086.1 hypothetical protein PSHT_07522 [Puccinia striiformis]KAH9466527.1 hypothetical protein Pst134EB_001580 [Puccinia striiformis f. sp. tritici]KAH9473285.1 hypothetical protein Pst134EA_000359 [Puccinia striiformis f. sp. tritici]KAI7962793.1 hypothetical protein MJO28_000887 [Puccinia striiformis f. sp. tritici]
MKETEGSPGTELMIVQQQLIKPGTPQSIRATLDSPAHPIIKPICRWTEEDDLTLIAILKAEQRRNPTPANGFKGSAWPAAARALAGSEEKTGSKPKDPTGCRSRYSALKRSYLELKHLRSLSESRWDENQKRVILPEEVWATFLANSCEKGKNMYRWRQKRFPLYHQVCDLIEGSPVPDEAKGAEVAAMRSTSTGSSADHNTSTPNETFDPLLWASERLEEDDQEEEEDEAPSLAAIRSIPSGPPSAKRRRITQQDMFLSHLKDIGDNLKSRPSVRIDAIRLLQLDAQLSEPELLKAVDYLGPLEHAETYIALDAQLRTTWIRTKIARI